MGNIGLKMTARLIEGRVKIHGRLNVEVDNIGKIKIKRKTQKRRPLKPARIP